MMKIKSDSTLYHSYLEVLKSRIFKILPLIEEENIGIHHYVDSLTFELYGLQNVIEGLVNSANYISLVSSMESVLDELLIQERDFQFIRSEIFKMIGLVEKMTLKKGG